MSELAVSREVAVPPERLWELITDLERAPEVISAVTSIRRLDAGEGFGVGTRWEETRTILGRDTTEVLEVVEVDPGRSYTVEAESLGEGFRSVITIEPSQIGSVITMSFNSEPTGAVSRVLAGTVGKLFEGGTRKALVRDLDDIAVIAESEG